MIKIRVWGDFTVAETIVEVVLDGHSIVRGYGADRRVAARHAVEQVRALTAEAETLLFDTMER